MAGLFGILNITADSFSDGGQFLEPQAALAHAATLLEGADVIDLGAASSHPDAAQVGPNLEIERLGPVVQALHSQGASLSIDSYQTAVQRWALSQGVDWLNDIQGFGDPTLYDELADADCRLVVMHSVQRAGPATRLTTRPEAVWDGMLRFFEARIETLNNAGIEPERLVLDPGMGFFLGADPAPSIYILRRIATLRARFGLPVLVSVSRKSFLRALTGRGVADIGPATLAAELFALGEGVDWVRTHAPRALRDAWAVKNALQ